MRSQAYAYATLLYPVYSRLGIQRITYLRHSRLFDIIEKTSVYHTVNGNRALFYTSKTAKIDKGYIT